jgi:hypothetical protein
MRRMMVAAFNVSDRRALRSRQDAKYLPLTSLAIEYYALTPIAEKQ